jgi:tRNA 2-thiouridine synthesizing protein E
MNTNELAGQSVELNDEGFLVDSEDWTREIAESLAAQSGITLTSEHWKVIDFARCDADRGKSPGLRRITENTGVSTKEVYRLFPKGPAKLIAKIAGIAKPKSCV